MITGDEALLSHLVNPSIFNTNLYIDRGVHISPIDAKWSSVLEVLYRIRVATVLIDISWPQEYNFTTAIICIVFTSRAAVEGEFNDFNIHKQVSFIWDDDTVWKHLSLMLEQPGDLIFKSF